MKLFVLSVTVPEGYRGDRSMLAQQIRASVRQVDTMDDEELLTGLVEAPEGRVGRSSAGGVGTS